jgi:hypothetical protein
VVAVGTVLFAFVGGASAITATGGGPAPDDGRPAISDDDLLRAIEVALAATGGGQVAATEIGDERACYEVEVVLEDGGRVDVELDESFAVIGATTELEGSVRGAADD